MSQQVPPSPVEWERIVPRIQEALSGLDSGSVEIVIQNAHVARVERQKKIRFEVVAPPDQNRKESPHA